MNTQRNYSENNTSSSLLDTSTTSPTTPKELFTNIDDNLVTMKSIYNTLIMMASCGL